MSGGSSGSSTQEGLTAMRDRDDTKPARARFPREQQREAPVARDQAENFAGRRDARLFAVRRDAATCVGDPVAAHLQFQPSPICSSRRRSVAAPAGTDASTPHPLIGRSRAGNAR